MIPDVRARIAAETRVLLVVAGPNGAGKSTFVETFLGAVDLRVVNPDAIARALSPADPGAVAYEAAALADGVRRDLLARGVSFCMETVFSDPDGAKLAFLRDARDRGYTVILVFIALDSSDLAIARVVERTQQGGHDVPDEKIAARYPRTFANVREALTSSITRSCSTTAPPWSRIASWPNCAPGASLVAVRFAPPGGQPCEHVGVRDARHGGSRLS